MSFIYSWRESSSKAIVAQSQGGQAVSHLVNDNKKVSDTPISDSTPHNIAELGMLCRRLERLAAVRLAYITQLETENDAIRADLLLWNEKEVK